MPKRNKNQKRTFQKVRKTKKIKKFAKQNKNAALFFIVFYDLTLIYNPKGKLKFQFTYID